MANGNTTGMQAGLIIANRYRRKASDCQANRQVQLIAADRHKPACQGGQQTSYRNYSQGAWQASLFDYCHQA